MEKTKQISPLTNHVSPVKRGLINLIGNFPLKIKSPGKKKIWLKIDREKKVFYLKNKVLVKKKRGLEKFLVGKAPFYLSLK